MEIKIIELKDREPFDSIDEYDTDACRTLLQTYAAHTRTALLPVIGVNPVLEQLNIDESNTSPDLSFITTELPSNDDSAVTDMGVSVLKILPLDTTGIIHAGESTLIICARAKNTNYILKFDKNQTTGLCDVYEYRFPRKLDSENPNLLNSPPELLGKLDINVKSN